MALPGKRDQGAHESWLVPFSCRWRNWKTAVGRIPRDCLLAADGLATAPLLAMRMKSLRRTFWKLSATWATPVVAPGRPCIARPTLYASEYLRHHPAKNVEARQQTFPRVSCTSTMYPSANIALPSAGNWSLICRAACGCAGTTTLASRGWLSASWSPI